MLDPLSHFLHLDVAPCGEARSKWALSEGFCPVFPWGWGEGGASLSFCPSSTYLGSSWQCVQIGLTLMWRRQTPFAYPIPIGCHLILPRSQCDKDGIGCFEEHKGGTFFHVSGPQPSSVQEWTWFTQSSLPEGRIWIYNVNQSIEAVCVMTHYHLKARERKSKRLEVFLEHRRGFRS